MADNTEWLRQFERKLVSEGKLIEAGWVGLRIAAIPPGAPKLQLEEMRQAFFAGAQHLFASIMHILDDDREPTPGDVERMDMIARELETFLEEFKRKHGFPPDAHT